jgi:hypothetical protein
MAFGDRFRNELNVIADLSQLEKFFEKNNPYFGFEDYAKNNGVTSSDREAGEAREILEIYLKANVSQITPLSDLGAAYFFNKIDKTVLKALEIINPPKVAANV